MRPVGGLRFSLAILVLCLSVVGLLAACKKKPKTPACETTADCKDGLACVNRQCVQCASAADCGDGQTCEDGACKAKPECAADLDCPDGKVCQGGTCQACAQDNECGVAGKCVDGACQRAKPCQADDDCADDEDCLGGVCQKPWDTGPVSTACTLSTVYFAYDDATIAASERDRLDANTACINKSPQRSVYVMGHTDASGTDEYNIALSERRAQTVADYLARLGVDPAKLQIVPKGETELAGDENKDRRVEFQWK
jgi:peptidoglycan-associated lipoprotein